MPRRPTQEGKSITMLTLIIGPMYSGKSVELIARAEPFKIAKKKVTYIKPYIDRRNNGIESRTGARADAITVKSLEEVPKSDVYIIDEAHMLPEDSDEIIDEWLDHAEEIIIGTLDTTYDGTVFPVINNIYALKPDEIVVKRAVCHVCLVYDAKYTQILDHNDVPLTEGLPKDLTEDGRYQYEARCRKCFVR